MPHRSSSIVGPRPRHRPSGNCDGLVSLPQWSATAGPTTSATAWTLGDPANRHGADGPPDTSNRRREIRPEDRQRRAFPTLALPFPVVLLAGRFLARMPAATFAGGFGETCVPWPSARGLSKPGRFLFGIATASLPPDLCDRS